MSKEQPKCKTCGGVKVVHSGEPTMYNCELGGDCSKDPNWTKEQCKTCSKTVPCPECMPVANKYYNLWHRDLREMNLAKQALDRAESELKVLKQQPTAGEFTKEIRTKLGNDPDPTTAYHWERLDKYWLCRNMFKLCAIIDRAESINKDLVKVCETIDGFLTLNFPKMTPTGWAITVGTLRNFLLPAITKQKEGQEKYQQPNDDPRQYGGESLPSKEDIESEEV